MNVVIAEGVFIDKNNNKYNYIEGLNRGKEIKNNKSVLYIIRSKYEVDRLNESAKDLEKVKINIEGYTKTRFIDIK